jgi:hypothetical protein
MPRIGNFEPNNAFAPFVQNSPGPVSAPNIPNTGAPITDAALHGANTLANDAAESRNVVTNGILDVAGVTLQKVQEKVQRQQEKKLAIEKAQQTVINNTAVNNALSNWRVGTNQAALNIRSNPANTDSWVPQLQKTIDDGLPDFMAKQNLTKDQQAIFRERISEAQTPYILDMQNAAGEVGKAYTQHTIDTRLNAQGLSGNQVKDMASLDLGIANIRDKNANQDVFDFYGPKADPMLAKTQEDYLANAIHANYANTGFVKDILKKYAPMLKGEQIEQFSKDADAQEQRNLEFKDQVRTSEQYALKKQADDLDDFITRNSNNKDGVSKAVVTLTKMLDNPLVKSTGALKKQISGTIGQAQGTQRQIESTARQLAATERGIAASNRSANAAERSNYLFERGQASRDLADRIGSPEGQKITRNYQSLINDASFAVKNKDFTHAFSKINDARNAIRYAWKNNFMSNKDYDNNLAAIDNEARTANKAAGTRKDEWAAPWNADDEMTARMRTSASPQSLYRDLGANTQAAKDKIDMVYREFKNTAVDKFNPESTKDKRAKPNQADLKVFDQWAQQQVRKHRHDYGI